MRVECDVRTGSVAGEGEDRVMFVGPLADMPKFGIVKGVGQWNRWNVWRRH